MYTVKISEFSTAWNLFLKPVLLLIKRLNSLENTGFYLSTSTIQKYERIPLPSHSFEEENLQKHHEFLLYEDPQASLEVSTYLSVFVSM